MTDRRTRLIVGALVLAVVGGTAALVTAKSPSSRDELEQMLGDAPHGPLHLVARQTLGGGDWEVYAYLDSDGRPCLIESLGGGSCHAHAGEVRGEIADYATGGGSWNDGGTGAEYVVVTGAVPLHTEAVVVEFRDGTVERVETHAPPGFDARVFALLSEGDAGRVVAGVRAARE